MIFLSKCKCLLSQGYVLPNQLIVFAAHDVLPNTNECKTAYLLLRCICAYLEVDLYAALEVHTTETIAAGQEALQYFSELMNVCLLDFLMALSLSDQFIRNISASLKLYDQTKTGHSRSSI